MKDKGSIEYALSSLAFVAVIIVVLLMLCTLDYMSRANFVHVVSMKERDEVFSGFVRVHRVCLCLFGLI